MTNSEKCKEILNKKFKASVFSGYDTQDVDEYFDEVIEYLQENEKRVNEAEEKAQQLELENQKLSNQVEKLTQLNNEQTIKIEEFRANGYENVVENSKATKALKNKEGK